MRVHLLRKTDSDAVDLLVSKLNPKVQLTVGEVGEGHKRTKVLVAGRPSHEEVTAFPDLETLIVPWIGIPPETLALIRKNPHINLHNLHHNAQPTAEMAVALLLAASKRIIPYDQALREHDWTLRYHRPSDILLLAGKKALILGYGEIGRRIGTALEGLGLEVLFIRRRTIETDTSAVFSVSALESLLPEVDFLILALPLTAETENLIGVKQLRLLPSSAILINIARGKIVNEAALFQALSEKWIFGAGLDVWFNYPKNEEERIGTPPGEYPWHTLENLVLSPHRAGHVRETEKLRMSALAELLNQAAHGKEIPNKVDPDLGY